MKLAALALILLVIIGLREGTTLAIWLYFLLTQLGFLALALYLIVAINLERLIGMPKIPAEMSRGFELISLSW